MGRHGRSVVAAVSARITRPGLYEMPAARYHDDPCAEPSLSASVAHILLSQSPAHAREAHPRLNPEHEAGDPTAEMDEGTALHAAILESHSVVAVCEFDDWRTGSARQARQLARDTGKIPILAKRWKVVQKVAEAVRSQLPHHEVGDVLHSGFAERVMVWQEDTPAGPIWMRSRVDWLPGAVSPLDRPAHIYDLKTVGGSAEPGAWGKKMATEGYALQAALYLRGARALGLPALGFRFIVVERDPPYALSVCECAPDLMHFAEQRAAAAISLFGRCLHDNDWPGYPGRVAHVEAPAWAVMQWEERALREEREAKPKPFYMPSDPKVANAGSPFA
jgi:hypothetical protein